MDLFSRSINTDRTVCKSIISPQDYGGLFGGAVGLAAPRSTRTLGYDSDEDVAVRSKPRIGDDRPSAGECASDNELQTYVEKISSSLENISSSLEDISTVFVDLRDMLDMIITAAKEEASEGEMRRTAKGER